jgi:hypothetical protein
MKVRTGHCGADGEVEIGAMSGDGDVCGTTVYLEGVSWCCDFEFAERCEHTVLLLVLIALLARTDNPIFAIFFTIFRIVN